MTMLNMPKAVKVGSLLFFLLLFFAAVGNAATYYVRTDGSNSNNGSTNRANGAWRDIDFAADHVSAGDVVRVQVGTYGERVTPAINGSSVSNTVTFVADGSVTVCGFDFSGNHYIRVIGFTIDTDAGGCIKNNGCVNLSGLNAYLEFWNNTFRDANYNGIRGLGAPSASNYTSNSLIIGNTFLNFGIGNGSGVAVCFPSDNNLIAYNEVYNVHPDAFYMFASNTRWLNNYTHDLSEASGGHSDVFQNGANYLGWENNLIEATFQVATGTQGDEHSAIVQNEGNCTGNCGDFANNIIRRNVWHNVSSGTWGIDRNSPGLSNIYIYHNTTAEAQENYGNNEAGIYIYHGSISGVYIKNNLEYESWGNNRTSGISVYYLEGEYNLDYNLAYDPNGTVSFSSPWTNQSKARSNANPYFNDYANDDFTISNTGEAYGNAGPLTTTRGSGSGTIFYVTSRGGGFFRDDNTDLSQYGGNLVVGDVVTVGTDKVRIASISGDAITVSESFSWVDGENVYFGDDTTPDIGAYPYNTGGYDYTAIYSISGGTVTVTPSDASLIRMVVVFEDGVPIGADSVSPYSVSGVGSGELIVRVYPLYASSTLYVDAKPSGEVSPSPPSALRFIK